MKIIILFLPLFLFFSCGLEVVKDSNISYTVEVTYNDNTKDTLSFSSDSGDPSLDTDVFNNSCCLETLHSDIACDVKSFKILHKGSVTKGEIAWYWVMLFLIGVVIIFNL